MPKVIFTLSTEDSDMLGLTRVGELTDSYAWIMDDLFWDRQPYTPDKEKELIQKAVYHFQVEGVCVDCYKVVPDGDDLLIVPRS